MIHFRTLRNKTECSGIERHSLCIRRWVRRQGYLNSAGEGMEGLSHLFSKAFTLCWLWTWFTFSLILLLMLLNSLLEFCSLVWSQFPASPPTTPCNSVSLSPLNHSEGDSWVAWLYPWGGTSDVISPHWLWHFLLCSEVTAFASFQTSFSVPWLPAEHG